MSLKFSARIILLFCFLNSLSGFEWPLDDVVLKKTFGEKSGRNFNSGITLGGDRQAVHPVDYGEVLFYYDDSRFYHAEDRIPSGLGNFVVLGHDRSLYSIYSHLEAGFLNETDGYILTPEDTIGWSGNTGDAPGFQLNLEIVDLEFNQMVNPLNLLPPIQDNTDPVVDGVWIADDGWRMLENGDILHPGERELFISVYDQSVNIPYFRPMAPYKLNIFANGEEVFYQTFEAIEAREGVLRLISKQKNRSFKQLYNEEGFIRIGNFIFNPGETILEVIISDYRGNKTFYTLKLRVST